MALVDVWRAYFYAPARRRDSLYGTRDAAQNGEEELASTLSDLTLTPGIACPCVWRGHIKGEHVVATVHGDDITIGENGQRWNSSSK